MIDRIIKAIDKLPAFPETIQKVIGLFNNEDYSVREVANVIKYDQAVTANILKISNSAYFGSRQKIKTIEDAVIYLGQQQLIRAVQTAGISKFFRKGAQAYVTQSKELWQHSVAVALMSQILSRKLMLREDPVLYTAALLHDVGKIIMGEYVYESYEQIRSRVTDLKSSFLEAEEAILGINHAELGGRIAEGWNFPTEIREAIAFHHCPNRLMAESNDIARLVYLADQTCLMYGIDGGIDALAYQGSEDVLRHFNLRVVDLEKSFIILHDELIIAKDFLEIM